MQPAAVLPAPRPPVKPVIHTGLSTNSFCGGLIRMTLTDRCAMLGVLKLLKSPESLFLTNNLPVDHLLKLLVVCDGPSLIRAIDHNEHAAVT